MTLDSCRPIGGVPVISPMRRFSNSSPHKKAAAGR